MRIEGRKAWAIVGAIFVAPILYVIVLSIPKERQLSMPQATEEKRLAAPLNDQNRDVIRQPEKIDPELLRLRGEVGVLRKTLREQTNKVADNSAPSMDRTISSDRFSDAGFATPESSIQTICWAAFTTNKVRYGDAIVWGEDIVKGAGDTNNIFFTLSNPGPPVVGFEVLGIDPVGADHVRATVVVLRQSDTIEMRDKRHMEFVNVNGEWKWFVPSPADVSVIPFIPPAPR